MNRPRGLSAGLLAAVLLCSAPARAQFHTVNAAEHAFVFDAAVNDLLAAAGLFQRVPWDEGNGGFLDRVYREIAPRLAGLSTVHSSTPGFRGDVALTTAVGAFLDGYRAEAQPVADSLRAIWNHDKEVPRVEAMIRRYLAHVNRLSGAYRIARGEWQQRYAAAFTTYLCDWSAQVLVEVASNPPATNATLWGRVMTPSGAGAERAELSAVLSRMPVERRAEAEASARDLAGKVLACMPDRWASSEAREELSDRIIYWIVVAPGGGSGIPDAAHFEVNVSTVTVGTPFGEPVGATTRLIARGAR